VKKGLNYIYVERSTDKKRTKWHLCQLSFVFSARWLQGKWQGKVGDGRKGEGRERKGVLENFFSTFPARRPSLLF
jgi:hypothetical protein